MISVAMPVPAGNAIRLYLTPPPGSELWRVLRLSTDSFSGPFDSNAALVYEGAERGFLDTASLVNGQSYTYRAYYFNGLTWTSSASVVVACGANFGDGSFDVLRFVRERIDLGLRWLISQQKLKPKSGTVPVLVATPAFDETPWPVVTLHLQQDAPAERAIGEYFGPTELRKAGDWEGYETWLSRVSLNVIVWSLNPEERMAYRAVVKSIVLANLEVFDSAGMAEVDFSMSDQDDFSTYSAPVYQAVGTLTCIAPSSAIADVPPIADIPSSSDYYFPPQ